ncbi:MAG: FecR family protein [Mangrovibacterium sp.]
MNEELLLKYILGQAENDEMRLVQEWISSSDENQNEFSRIRNIWILSGLENEIDPVRKQVGIQQTLFKVKEQNRRKRVKELRLVWGRYAALLLLAIVISGVSGYFISGQKNMPNQGIEVIAAIGERSQVVLPDGSKVELNSGSTLRLEPSFGSKKRVVKLDGEAFFRIAHDASRPFVVKTSKLDVEVLGTVFNICSYSNEPGITTFLESGKVKIKTENGQQVLLKPLQTADFNKESGKIEVVDQGSDYLVDWTRGMLTMKEVTIESLSKKLERKFNVTICFGDEEVKTHRYTGSIRDEQLDTILEALRFSSDLNYIKQEGQVTLYSN